MILETKRIETVSHILLAMPKSPCGDERHVFRVGIARSQPKAAWVAFAAA